MLEEIARLRDQARRARRLAAVSSDKIARTELSRYAEECDANADALEQVPETAAD